MKNFHSFAKRAGMFFFAAAIASTASAQFLRTAYLQDVPYSLQMNPAQVPSHGYFSPILGPVSVTAQSNAFGTADIQDMFDAKGDYYSSSDFMDKLKSENNLNMNISWDQINVGWFKGNNFWNFSTGTRIEMGATVPKSIFTFMNDMNGKQFDDDMWMKGLNADIDGERIALQVYQEVGIGFARKINDKLTVGAKAKLLLGAANVDFEVKQMEVTTPAGIDIEKVRNMDETFANANLDWSKFQNGEYKQDDLLKAIRNEVGAHGKAGINVSATGKASMGGLEWKYDTDNNGNNTYINGAKMNGFKISGYGLGLDLGVTYEVIDNLEITAAVTDLGFISWSKSNSKKIDVDMHQNYNLDQDETTYNPDGTVQAYGLYDFAKKVSSNEIVNFDMLQMKEDEGDSYTTSLYTTIALGGQYSLLNNKLVLGALYTGRMAKPKSIHELTLSGAYNLSTLLNVAFSYSMIQSAGKSFGLGLKFGPLYVGTDYMFFGSNTKCANVLAGLSIPLGKGKKFAM